MFVSFQLTEITTQLELEPNMKKNSKLLIKANLFLPPVLRHLKYSTRSEKWLFCAFHIN